MLVSIIIEPFGALVDELGDEMAADEAPRYLGGRKVTDLNAALATYGWAMQIDLADRDQSAFWCTSAAKLEPRLGKRFEEDGADVISFDIPHQVQAAAGLATAEDDMLIADFMCATRSIVLSCGG